MRPILTLVPPSPAPAAEDPAFFECSSRPSGRDAAWVRTSGELDLAGSPRLAELLGDAQAQARLVVLDLHELTFMDVSAVHVVVDAAMTARRSHGWLIVLRNPAPAEDVFDLTGMVGAIDSHRSGPLLKEASSSRPTR